jgi:ABC-2 type transport system permease protein
MNWTRYLRFTKNSIQRNLSYRANVLFYLFGSLVQTMVLYYLWKAIFNSAGGGIINGFSFPQMISYLLASVAVQSAANGNADEIIADEIMDGTIAFNLARPISYRARVFFDHLGVSIYNFIAAGIPALAVAFLVMRGSGGLDPARAFIFAVSLVMSFMLVFFYKF